MAITLSRDHLRQNRRMIIGRALAAAAAGTTPVPILEEWLTATVRRGTVRRIADANQVDLDDEAVKAIADGEERPPQWHELVGSALFTKYFTRAARKLLIAVVAARRTQAAGRYFMLDTLFDHYCSRMHVGLGLDGASARELRGAMDRALAMTPGGLTRRLFRTGIVSAARATVRAPVEVANALTAGRLRKLLRSGDVEVAHEVDDALERQLGEERGFLARATTAIELQLAADNNPYIDAALDNFERLWNERRGDHDDG